MTEERLQEIYQAVIRDGFYTVGKDPFLTSDISHVEMQDLVKMACKDRSFTKKD